MGSKFLLGSAFTDLVPWFLFPKKDTFFPHCSVVDFERSGIQIIYIVYRLRLLNFYRRGRFDRFGHIEITGEESG